MKFNCDFTIGFKSSYDSMQYKIHTLAVEKGWWPKDKKSRNEPELLCLIHSELSEALEAYRNSNPPDSKTPEFSSIEVELADAVIRIMDYSQAFGYDVSGAILAKHNYNLSRSHRHGGKKA